MARVFPTARQLLTGPPITMRQPPSAARMPARRPSRAANHRWRACARKNHSSRYHCPDDAAVATRDNMRVSRWRHVQLSRRAFSSSSRLGLVRNVSELPDRIVPQYKKTKRSEFLALQWPQPPRNILLVKKSYSVAAKNALLEFADHITKTYPSIALVAEPSLAQEIHNCLSVPLYSTSGSSATPLHTKTDLVATFGGDGTILQASALFASVGSVPPVLAFSMGTLGFLGEWKFADYRRAFRQAYYSSAKSFEAAADGDSPPGTHILLRQRLKVAVFDSAGRRLAIPDAETYHALNEVLLHRGSEPALIRVDVRVSGQLLTEGVADGMLISTPTGSTAYSLSAGGSIIHPLVPSLLVTPVCPRSLSFRPLVLPNKVEVVLKLGQENRGKQVEIAVDGIRRVEGLTAGAEVRVTGEAVRRSPDSLTGGVPCIMGSGPTGQGDGWVGGLNSLLKYNYPLGENVDI